MPLRVTFIRHGQTECNADGDRHQVATTPLSTIGRQQATLLARHLAAERLRPAAIYSSDLDRAHTTARMIAVALDVPVQVDSRLREIDVGVFKGMRVSDAASLHPEIYRRWREGDCEAICPEGECGRDVQKRAAAFLSHVSDIHTDDQLILAVTHGRFVQSLAMHVLQIPSPAHLRLHTPNTGRFTFQFDRVRGWELVTWGDAHHLSNPQTLGPGM